jgi:Fe-S cluster assembly protein SufB
MLKISRLADYATRVLFLLAADPSKRYSATQVASETHISTPTVSKVLKLLNEAKLVNSERGVNGGYQLARAPEQIGVAEIIAAIDGRVAITECSRGDNICKHQNICELRGPWQMINKIVLNVLQDLTLADMLRPQTLELFKQKNHA